MIYALILTVFLGTPDNMIPFVTEVTFKTQEECIAAAKTASFKTVLPVLKASAVCEQRPQT